MEINSTECCGVKEISELSDWPSPKLAMIEFAELYHDNYSTVNAAIFTFTGVTNERYGQNFATFIRKHRLGRVVKTHSVRNPRTRHFIALWAWTLNKTNLRHWWRKNENNID